MSFNYNSYALTSPIMGAKGDTLALVRQIQRDGKIIRAGYEGLEYHCVTTHKDITAFLSGAVAENLSSGLGVFMYDLPLDLVGVVAKGNVLFNDGEQHIRLRTAIMRSLDRASMDASEEKIKNNISAIVDSHLGVEFDVVKEIAREIPFSAICTMLDIPDDCKPKLKNAIFALAPAVMTFDMDFFYGDGANCLVDLVTVFSDLIDRSAKSPEDFPLLIKLLAGYKLKGTEDSLDIEEAIQGVTTLFIAANETMMSTITSIMGMMVNNKPLMESLRGGEISVSDFVEEVFRFWPAVHQIRRTVAVDFEYEGVSFKTGERVIFFLSAAARDPGIYVDPDTFNPNREKFSTLISFGAGKHYCLGARLAKMVVSLYVEKLISAVDSVDLVGNIMPLESFIFNGYQYIHVQFNQTEEAQ